MAIIADVIAHYGRYDASLERAFIQAQQRVAAPLPMRTRQGSGLRPSARIRSLRQTVLRFLRDRPGTYLSAGEIAQALAEDQRRVHYTIGDLVQEGFLRKGCPHHPGRGRTQTYAAR